MNSKNILLIEDSSDQNQSCCKVLEKEGFSVSVERSVENALKFENKPELIILNLKSNFEDNKNLIKRFKGHNIQVIFCSEWGKDKMSFPLWTSDVKIVKAGDQNDLKWAIKETLW